jgi:membrane protease YdiL (CAAX protease family)
MGDSWRIPAAVAGVWVMSFVVYTIMMGGTRLPDPSRGERLKVGVWRMYLCMVLGGAVGALIWGGTAWQVFSGLVIWWFLGVSLWQGVVRKLRYLLEPTEEALPRMSLAHALVAVLVFFAVQGVFALTGLVLLSYAVAGVVTALYCAITLSFHSLPRPSREGGRLAVAVLSGTLVCVAAGVAWALTVKHVPPFREWQEGLMENATVVLDPRSWQVVLLLVVAAPLIEEFLFRGFVLRIMLTTWSSRAAIFASALLFAVVHPGLSFPPVFLLGLATAWLYTRSGRIWPGIILHAVYNGVIVMLGW